MCFFHRFTCSYIFLFLQNNVYFDKMWSTNFDGIVREELYDVILEVAAYAKKHLEIGRSY